MISFAFQADKFIMFDFYQKGDKIICIDSEDDANLGEVRYFNQHYKNLGWERIKRIGEYEKKVVLIEEAQKNALRIQELQNLGK